MSDEMEVTINTLKQWDTDYYNGGDSGCSDVVYDTHKTRLMVMFPDDIYFQTVGAEPTTNKVDLPYVLGSLKKKKYDGSTIEWINSQGIKTICASEKLDGCSIYVEYNDGQVQSASTRGNGYQGQDITSKAKVFCKEIEFKGELHLRGEAMMLPEVSKGLGYKNPRNAVAGILNREEHINVESIIPMFYTILNGDDINTATMHFRSLEAYGLITPWNCKIVEDKQENFEDTLATLYKERKDQSPMGIDGIVISDDDNFQLENEYYPTNSVAYKVNEDAVEAVVKKVVWGVTRTGRVNPVVYIDPIDINGSTISKATGFNALFITENNIKKGSRVGIIKAGEIIPFITECYDINDKNTVKLPSWCPSCHAELSWSDSHIHLVCTSDDCYDKKLYHMENFLLSLGVEEMTYNTLLTIGVQDIPDLYELSDFELIEIDGIGPKKAQTILTQIKNTLITTPDKLLKSFGLDGVGNTSSKDITDKYESFEDLFDVSMVDFMTINGIGIITAKNLVEGLKKFRGLYDFLKEKGLTFQVMDTSMKGVIFTLTGKSDIKRNDLTKMITSQGGSVKGVSKSSSYVVTNDTSSTTGKMKKAIQHNIKVITYDELYDMLGMEV